MLTKQLPEIKEKRKRHNHSTFYAGNNDSLLEANKTNGSFTKRSSALDVRNDSTRNKQFEMS